MATKKVKTKQEKTSKSSAPTKKRVWRLSASMLKTFLTCKRKFYENYIVGTGSPANESFSLGNSVHHALELANLFKMENPRALTGEEIEYFVDEGRKYMSNTYISTMESFDIMEDLVRNELSRPFEEEVLAAEVKFDMVTPEGVPIIGYIDMITKVDEKTIRIVDYKTSKTALSSSEAEHDEQLSMYDLAGAVLYPEYPNRILELRYLRLGDSVTSRRDEFYQYKFRKQIAAIFNSLMKFVEEHTDSDEGVVGNTEPFCHYCAYKSKCPEYTTYLKEAHERTGFVPITELTDNTAVSELKKVSILNKFIEERKTELKLWMANRIEADPETPVKNPDFVVKPLCKSRRNYDVNHLANLLPKEQFLKVCSVKAGEVNKLLKVLEDPDLKMRIERSARVSFDAPQYRLSKNKEEKPND
jgi:RecB family exonuclease